ncbi:MAG TPA: segregation/condensation protein A [Terracidiphilus sp.]|nr:segregation/condensation protein A [Terracidiphilus sp.]
MTDHTANPETIAAEPVAAAESAPAPIAESDNAIELVSVAADAPVVESASTPAPEDAVPPNPVPVRETAPEHVPTPEAAPQQEPEKEPAVEAVTIAEPTPAAEPVPEDGPAAAVEPVVESPAAEPVIEPIDLIDPSAEQRAEQATVAEPATEPVPLAEAASVAEPAPAAEPVVESPAAELVVESPAAPSAEQAAAPGQEPAAPGQEAAALAVLISQPAPEQISDEKAAAKLAARQKMLDEASELSPFSVSVGQVYDGPLDLLLNLIRSQDIDIYDIPIAKITAQFLAYVNQLKASDVDVAGEFIYTASLLIHIKSKMLLPRAPAGPGEAPEDPRRELVERLLEHERFKNAAQMLQQKQMLEAATWSNPGSREFADDDAPESEIAPEIAADTLDLVRIFRDILERARKRPIIDVSEDSVTVGQMIQFLARRLTLEDKPVALRRLLSHTRSERALVAIFLALLELVRLQAILLRQDRAFSEIFVKKHTGFDAVISGGLMNVRDDWK